MEKLFRIISKKFDVELPATAAAIERAETHFGFEFPKDYKDFMKFTNGLEGETAESYTVIWSAEELIELNQAYHVTEFISDVIIFGYDGGEEAFAFDTSNTGRRIVKIPFIGMGHIATERLLTHFRIF